MDQDPNPATELGSYLSFCQKNGSDYLLHLWRAQGKKVDLISILICTGLI